MHKEIFDRFEIVPISFDTVCDSSLNPQTVKNRISEYNERYHKEAVYRALYQFGIINPNNACIKQYKKNGNTVFFVLDVYKMKKAYPNISEKMTPMFRGMALEYWKKLVSE